MRGGRGGGKGFGQGEDITSAVDFKRHIEVLHYLLQLWPGEEGVSLPSSEASLLLLWKPLYLSQVSYFCHLPQCRLIEFQ